MNTYKTKSQRLIAIILAILILMPTQAMAAVANRISKKPEIIIDSTPQKKSDDFVISTKDAPLPHFNISVDSLIDDTDLDNQLVKWYIAVENNYSDAADPGDKSDVRSLDATFFISKTSGLKNLKIEKVYNSEGKSVPHTKKVNNENRKDDLLDTMGISTRVPSKITYYLTAEIENPSDIYTLDYSFKTSFDDFKLTKRHAIDVSGNIIELDEIVTSKQTYKDDEKTIFTDFILSETTKSANPADTKFEYEIAPETKDSKIIIEYYKSTEEGFIKDDSKAPIVLDKPTDKIELKLDEGELAKVVTETKNTDLVFETVDKPIPMSNIAPQSPEIIKEVKPQPETKFEIDKKEVAPTIIETDKLSEKSPEIIIDEVRPESTKPEIIIEEAKPEVVNIETEKKPIIIEETKPIFVIEPKKEVSKRPEIKIDENIFDTKKELQAPKTKLVLDKQEGSKENVKIELETRREELDKKIATLDAEKEKAKTTLATSKPEITLDEKEEKFSLDKSLKTGDDLMANIESSEITENDLAIVVNELGIETEKSAKETLAEKLVSGELSEDELKIYLEDLILRKELSTEEIQLVIDSIGNEYDLNKLELKEILRLATEKLNNNNEKIASTLKEHGVAIDLASIESEISQSEVIRLLKENGKSEKQAREIASTLFEKTGYELNPEKVLRDALANKTLTREELENLIDEIVKEYGIDKTEVERIIDRLNLEDSSKEELVKDIIELNSNDEEISLNLVKSRLYNIIKTFELNDDERLAMIENLKGSTKGEILKSLDETLPTYGFGEVDIERIKTNIFTEVESYELVEKLREILTPYAVTELQILEILDRIFLNPNLTPDELRVRIKEVLPEYNFGTEDVEKITNELLPLETKTPVELLNELLDSGELTYDKLVEFLKELKEKHNLSDDEIAGLVNDNRTQIEELIDDKTLTDTLFSNTDRLKVTKFAYEVIYNNGETTGVKEVLNEETTTEEIEEVEEKSFIAKVLEPLTELFSSKKAEEENSSDKDEEIQTIKIEETQKSQYELKSPEEVLVEEKLHDLIFENPTKEYTETEVFKYLAKEAEGVDLSAFNLMEKLEEARANLENLIEVESGAAVLIDDAEEESLGLEIAPEEEISSQQANGQWPSKFHLLTEMNVKAIPTWRIPAGWWFDVNIGPYLKPDPDNPLKPLVDPDNPNLVIATPEYNSQTNTIRYYFPKSVSENKNLPINQILTFNKESIGNADKIEIKISVKPKNNVRKSMPTIVVDKNSPDTIVTAFPNGKVPINTPTEKEALKRTYPYDISYWTYQYWDGEKVNWDIKINTSEVKLDYLDYNKLGLSIYAPENQGLEGYNVTLKDYKGSEFSNNPKGVTPNGKTTGYNETGFLSPDGNMLSFNKQFEKSDLPDELFIHIEAAPKDGSPVYTMYDLGLRLTPDNNYIIDILEDFKSDYNKLLSMMPWIVPFKSGDEAVKKFDRGFNVLDTRIPANTQAGWAYDNIFDGKSYNDKSRSVYGRYNDLNLKTLTWQISDTLRLQDDERLLKNDSTLGNDILVTKSFNANLTNISKPNIIVLEPNTDGTYTQILNTNSITTGESLRNELKAKRPFGLLPGTIINYIYTATATELKKESTLEINFTNRYDDGAGSYGGNKVASITKETQPTGDNNNTPSQVVGPSGRGTNTNHDGNKYSAVYGILDGKEGTSEDKTGYVKSQIIYENGQFVYCLNPRKHDPGDYYEKIRLRKYENVEASLIKESANRSYSDFKTNQSPQELEDSIKKVFYFTENYNFKSEADKYYTTEALIYRAIDGKLGKGYGNVGYEHTNNMNVGPAEYAMHSDYGVMWMPDVYKANIVLRKYPNDLGYRANSAIAIDKIIKNSSISQDTINKAVTLDLYKIGSDTGDNTSNKNNNLFQELIGARVRNPIEFSKIDAISNKKINGATFEIVSKDGKFRQEFSPSETLNSILYLEAGEYTLIEKIAPAGYEKLSDTSFVISEISSPKSYDTVYRESSIGTKPKSAGKVEAYDFVKGRGTKITEATGSNLLEVHDNGLKLTAKNNPTEQNPETYSFKINKQILGADGKYTKFSNVKFTLKEDGYLKTGFKEGITDRNGEIEFDELPKNSNWTLKEIVPAGIKIPSKTTWKVEVNNFGNIKIDNNVLDSSRILEVKNEPDVPGKFKIKKIDSLTTEPIKNVEFTLYGRDKKTPIGQPTNTNDKGEIYYWDIPDGIYYLKETVPSGYKAKSVWSTIIVNNGNVTKANIDAEVTDNSITLPALKTDQSTTKAIIVVNEIEQTVDITSDGTISTSKLPDGTITIKDINKKEVAIIEVKNGKIVGINEVNKPSDNMTPIDPSKPTDPVEPDNPTPDPTDPVEPQYPRNINLSRGNYYTTVRNPNGLSDSYFVNNGKLDVSSWSTGTYRVEDESARKLYTVYVENGYVININEGNLYENYTLNSWKSNTNYYVDAYPDYMNMKDYSVLTNPSTGVITTYIMLKPDADGAGANGTNRNTYLEFAPVNAKVNKVEMYRVGNGSTKSTVSRAMNNQDVDRYIGTDYAALTNESAQNNPFKMSLDRYGENSYSYQTITSSYSPNSNQVYITLPKERFGNDWSFIVKVTSTIKDKTKGGEIYYLWNTEAPGLSQEQSTTPFPAIVGERKVSSANNSFKLADNKILSTIKTSYNKISEIITPTVYAAESDVFKLDPSLVSEIETEDNLEDYIIEEKSFPEKLLEVSEALNSTSIGSVLSLPSKLVPSNSAAGILNDIAEDYILESGATLEIREETTPSSQKATVNDIKISNDLSEVDVNIQNTLVEFEIENIPDTPGEFEIIKYSESFEGDKLAGAKFGLFSDPEAKEALIDKLGKEITETTDNKGYAKFENLTTGTYYLKETEAPKDHRPLKTIWTVKVESGKVTITSDENNGLYKITEVIENNQHAKLEVINKKPVYPYTGGAGESIIFLAMGAIVMAVGAVIYGKRKREY